MNSRLPIALHILGFLTARGGEPLTSEVMAATYGTSPVVLRRVLAQLQRAGLVETRRGVNGGSVLARDPGTITVRDAYEAVTDDPEVLPRHPADCSGRIERAMGAFVNELMSDAEAALLERLDSVTIAEMDTRIRASLRRPSVPTER
ncbi:MAG: Rrf2 family transcriptional regulator [Actinomycetota bacterium]